MKFKSLKPILWTDDLGQTITFYKDVLGFAIRERNDDWGWASLTKDGVEIMLAKPNAHTPFEEPKFTGSFYINTDDVDRVWQQVKDKAKVCYEPENFDWGMREFAIYDNNGYLVQIGQNTGPEA